MTTSTLATQVYRVIAHEAEEGGYWGEVLELPGCVSQGETLDELQQNIREAIEAVLLDSTQQDQIQLQQESVIAEKDDLTLGVRFRQRGLQISTQAIETWTVAH